MTSREMGDWGERLVCEIGELAAPQFKWERNKSTESDSREIKDKMYKKQISGKDISVYDSQDRELGDISVKVAKCYEIDDKKTPHLCLRLGHFCPLTILRERAFYQKDGKRAHNDVDDMYNYNHNIIVVTEPESAVHDLILVYNTALRDYLTSFKASKYYDDEQNRYEKDVIDLIEKRFAKKGDEAFAQGDFDVCAEGVTSDTNLRFRFKKDNDNMYAAFLCIPLTPDKLGKNTKTYPDKNESLQKYSDFLRNAVFNTL